jgi:glucose/arabinose dehydrogenase
VDVVVTPENQVRLEANVEASRKGKPVDVVVMRENLVLLANVEASRKGKPVDVVVTPDYRVLLAINVEVLKRDKLVDMAM